MSVIEEKDVLMYINEARTNPTHFARHIQKQLESFVDEKNRPVCPGCLASSHEGKTAWKEAVKFLREAKPVQPLTLHEGLNLASQDHAIDITQHNTMSMAGTDGSSQTQRLQKRCGKLVGSLAGSIGISMNYPQLNHALETVMNLVINDGLPNRPNRTNLLSPTYKYLGCSSRLNEKTNFICTVLILTSQKLPTINSQPNNVKSQKKKHEIKNQNIPGTTTKKEDQENKGDPNFKGNTMSVIPDLEILKYTNEARTNPKKFAEYVKKQLGEFIDQKLLPMIPSCNYSTNEGKSVWIETIKFLEEQKPLPPLQINQGLSLTAEDHVVDLVKNKLFGHSGSDGSRPRDRIDKRCGKSYGASGENISNEFAEHGRNHALESILSLIIDDGVKSRGHRTNIFSTDFRYMGCASRVNHKKEIVTVINYHSLDVPLINNKVNNDKAGSSLPYKVTNDGKVIQEKSKENKADPHFKGNKMSVIPDFEVLKYTNQARTNPKKFAEYVKKQLGEFIDETILPLKPGCNYRTNEGKSVWRETIKFLEEQKPLPPFQINQGLSLTAEDHVIDLVKNKMFGHSGSDGKRPRDRIDKRCGKSYGASGENISSQFNEPGRNHALESMLSLIIDDGVKSRGHRTNIFSTDFHFMGCASRVNHQNKIVTVINYHSLDVPLIKDTPNMDPIGSSLPHNNIEVPKPTPNKVSSKSFAPHNNNQIPPSNIHHQGNTIFHQGNYGGRMAQNGANLMSYGLVNVSSNMNPVNQNHSLPPPNHKAPNQFGSPAMKGGFGSISKGQHKSKGKMNNMMPIDTLQEMLNAELNGMI